MPFLRRLRKRPIFVSHNLSFVRSKTVNKESLGGLEIVGIIEVGSCGKGTGNMSIVEAGSPYMRT